MHTPPNAGPPAGGPWEDPGEPSRSRTGLVVAVAAAAALVVLGALGIAAINSIRDSEPEFSAVVGSPSRETRDEPETSARETTEPEPTEPGTTEGTAEPEAGPDEEADETTDPGATEAPDENLGPVPFGEAVVYEDGISVTVDPPEEFDPSETAAYDESPAYVRFTVTVANDGTDDFDMLMFLTWAQSGQHEGSEVFDIEQGLEGPPDTTLLAGRTVSWDIGYGVDDPEDIVLEVSPSLEHEEAIFTSG